MDNRSFTEVSGEAFKAYPGEKMVSGYGDALKHLVRNDELRPISDQTRNLADRLLEVLKDEGLLDQLAVGGVPASVAIDVLADAMVTVVDEALPQYARKAVGSFQREITRHSDRALVWSAGASQSAETTLARASMNNPPDPKFSH